ncbi:hypothetical protein M440DRAFT_1098844 [Trichoderma longibrachiatum ATCC 18648]|uniref:Uncharacterized protein n=1 Tax=Trichoderma longibrachiatum ATCC 18648 TaxID=983965 RepID=A0A2T4BS07_TRILO|nr:hypothetical protein M440DRAFT_1098844 [Trichoderma longibrachiatum ATCC 18648]
MHCSSCPYLAPAITSHTRPEPLVLFSPPCACLYLAILLSIHSHLVHCSFLVPRSIQERGNLYLHNTYQCPFDISGYTGRLLG